MRRAEDGAGGLGALSAGLTGFLPAIETMDAVPQHLRSAALAHLIAMQARLLARDALEGAAASDHDRSRSAGLTSPVGGDDRYLSIRELASRLPYAEHTIRNLIAAGALQEGTHYFKRRGRVMFSWVAMRCWVEARQAPVATLPLVRNSHRGR